MIPAMRGVMDEYGDIWVWPTVLFDHRAAFARMPHLGSDYRARFRQWEPQGPIDFDPGVSDEDRMAVEDLLSSMGAAG